jgi:hypothetical protein
MLAIILAACLASGAAWAADVTVTVEADSMKAEAAINAALKAAAAGDVVTVDGSVKVERGRIGLTIPDGVTVKWAAELVQSAPGLGGIFIISSPGSGVFEVVDGGSISITADKPGIYGIKCGARGAIVKVSGGAVKAAGEGGMAINTDRGKLEVSGGTVTASGDGSFALYAEDDAVVTGGNVIADGKECFAVFCRSAITVSGGTVKATGEGSYALRSAAGGDITVSGGEVTGEVDSLGGKLVHTGGTLNGEVK